MSFSDDTPEQIPPHDVGNLLDLINMFRSARHVLAGPIDEEKGQGGAGPSNPGTVAAPPMPVPSVIFPQPCPQPTVASQFAAAHEALHPTVLSPQPANLQPLSTGLNALPPVPMPVATPASPAPARPPSPDDANAINGTLAWHFFTEPLYARLAERVFVDFKGTLPEPLSGMVVSLKLSGYGARNTVDNMCALVAYLDGPSSGVKLVDRFIAEQQMTSHWPAKLENQPYADHVKYTWRLMNGLLCATNLSISLEPAPPPTFAGAASVIFPPVPEGVTKPERFAFSARELVEEDFLIKPTSMLLDHLKLDGNAVRVYALSADEIRLLYSYHQNKVASAIGMGNYGREIMQSYGALVNEEFHDKYQWPIERGMFNIRNERRVQHVRDDDLTIISLIIEDQHKNARTYYPPNHLAGRVHIIEAELRRRRRWYRRLLRDIRKQKKAQPWVFWGTVLAVFFGICSVIQTVTSVWSLAIALS